MCKKIHESLYYSSSTGCLVSNIKKSIDDHTKTVVPNLQFRVSVREVHNSIVNTLSEGEQK